MTRRIYLDNAATSFPKPDTVLQAMNHYALNIGASAGRGAYKEAIESARIIDQTRRKIATLINAANPNSIIMTFNCTDALSLAIKGTLKRKNAHVITSSMDHNSVLRPLSDLKKHLDIDITYIPADPQGLIDPHEIRRAIKPNTKLIVIVHASNVCGSIQDIETIGQIARVARIPFLVDAAQSVGHIPVDVQKCHIDMLAFPGHKGLLGPLGTGALYIRPGLENHISPLRLGGTGSKSELPIQPDFLPDRFESGSHNAIGIAGLNAALDFLLEKGIESIRDHDRKLCRAFLELTADIPALTIYGPTDLDNRIGVFSVKLADYDPTQLAAVLEQQFGLLTRPGLHCAPFAHQALGTFETGGTTRLSTGPFTTLDDITYAAGALAQIAHAHVLS